MKLSLLYGSHGDRTQSVPDACLAHGPAASDNRASRLRDIEEILKGLKRPRT